MAYDQVTEDWRLYQAGIDYNNQLKFPSNTNYYNMLDENERMVRGDQWRGVKANGLPTPVFNIEKPIKNYQVAAVCSDELSMKFHSEKLNVTKDGWDEDSTKLADILTAYVAKFAEENKLNDKKYQLVDDAFVTGDMAMYVNFNEKIETGQYRGKDENGDVQVMGDIEIHMVDGCNVILGNYSDPEINANGRMKQPYVCLVFRNMTKDVQEEAKANDIDTWEEIRGDEDYEYQVGDNSDYTNDAPESDKTTVVLRIYREEDGSVWCSKSTKFSPVKKPWKTPRKLCPVVFSGWERTKNSYHYQSPLNAIHPNQRYINKMFAIVMLIQLLHANPRLVINKAMVTAITNKIGSIIEVNGDTSGAAKYLEVAASKSDITAVIEQVISLTREMAGANDVLQGNIDPEQASGRAIVASVKQANVPIILPKQNLKQMWEDLGLVLKDTMEAYYGTREVTVELGEDGIVTEEIDFSTLADHNIKMKIDVGAASVYDDIARQTTLDNALAANHIDFVEWLERLPVDAMPDIEGLIEARKPTEEQFTPEQLAAVMKQQPPEVQQQLAQMPSEQRYMTLTQLASQQSE